MSIMDVPQWPPGVRATQVTTWRKGEVQAQPDCLAEEVPIALVFNGITHAVMLASPADLQDFALGFGLSEGLLKEPAELYGVEVAPLADGIELQLEVAAACEWRLKERRRSLAGRTGCGLCGADSLAQVRQALASVPPTRLQPGALTKAQQGLRAHQIIQQLTGATHAAAWCSPEGEVLLVREDIGRHNALDKLIGAMSRQGISSREGFVCITSRASFEMVQKAAMAGVGVLAAVSAPTALAVQCALSCGLALAGFVRGDDLVAYSHPERLGLHADGV
ncbi:formate dehydrogenase accessory sulfurtransferase FdhD [Roseateles koreensis]|uniref:Sulfur carrier protein FdhD n=1 Tax=Roseateles koreensis TaxID=2987526 RepID=A0ABT5KQQ1_9BURK|nr:formate dehydrogenase accessory sulfurtransferase FdhD [Roseateles koreensis]MDC8785229.1 formate dehydrogenase accessory sulfurtransferase FdhD [Roseateles koreensis]